MSKRQIEAELASQPLTSTPRLEVEDEADSSPEVATALRISTRVLRKKEERRGSESEPALALETALGSPRVGEKPRRTWEQWSGEDKDLFFEAVNEYGKNFDSIESHFQSKCKKKTLFKTREQIRTFYYRTWHKISAHIQFPDHLKKSFRELYGLINYGELRKRLGHKLDDKHGSKLQELVFNGLTLIRVKGKTYRIKTPICRALKRLVAKLDGSKGAATRGGPQSHLKTLVPPLPEQVNVDLRPLSEADWAFVHGRCFQNPHLKVTVSLQQRLSALVELLERKWIQRDLLKATHAGRGVSKTLWLQAKPGTVLSQPILTSVEPLTHASMSLSQIQEKLKSNGQAKGPESPQPDDPPQVLLPPEDNLSSDETNEGVEKCDTEIKSEDPAPPSDPVDAPDQTSHGTEWDGEAGKSVTFGELFLMLGLSASQDMALCYSFRDSFKCDEDEPRAPVVSPTFLAQMAQSELNRKQKVTHSPLSKLGSSPTSQQPCKSPYTSSPGRSLPKSDQSGPESGKSLNGHPDEFRRPNAPRTKYPPTHHQSAQAFKQQLTMLLPKYSNRKGRVTTRKTNVVSRQLLANRPLHPKNNLISPEGHMKLRIVADPKVALPSPTTQASSTLSVAPNLPTLGLTPMHPQLVATNMSSMPPNLLTDTDIPTISIPDSSRPTSPTGSITSLLDSSLAELTSSTSHSATKTDHFLDSVLENSNSSVLQTPPRHRPTPPSSPSRAVQESWLPELSLSSLLNINESPLKNGAANCHGALLNEDSAHSVGSEVDRQILSMMTETSVDFTNKFAKLASHVND